MRGLGEKSFSITFGLFKGRCKHAMRYLKFKEKTLQPMLNVRYIKTKQAWDRIEMT